MTLTQHVSLFFRPASPAPLPSLKHTHTHTSLRPSISRKVPSKGPPPRTDGMNFKKKPPSSTQPTPSIQARPTQQLLQVCPFTFTQHMCSLYDYDYQHHLPKACHSFQHPNKWLQACPFTLFNNGFKPVHHQVPSSPMYVEKATLT